MSTGPAPDARHVVGYVGRIDNEDRERLDTIMATGRFFKLAYATARAYEQIEREFGWTRDDHTED